VVSGTAKAGIDIAEGTVQSVGNLLIKGSSSDVDANTQAQIAANIFGPAPAASTLDRVLNSPAIKQMTEPAPDASTSAIQSSTWCLVGEVEGTRTCADVSSNTLCLSGKYYTSESSCKEGFEVQLPVLKPPQYMGPPNFPPPGMIQGPPLLGVGPPNYIQPR
jgi:hypothetical protein